MAASIFDSRVVHGWTDPDAVDPTPGVLLKMQRTVAAADTLVRGGTAGIQFSRRVPPSYIEAGMTAYVAWLAVQRRGRGVTRAHLSLDALNQAFGTAAGPHFTVAALASVAVIARNPDGVVRKFRMSEIGDTTEPYLSFQWPGMTGAWVSTLARAGGDVVFVDTSHPNIDYANNQVISLTGNVALLAFTGASPNLSGSVGLSRVEDPNAVKLAFFGASPDFSGALTLEAYGPYFEEGLTFSGASPDFSGSVALTNLDRDAGVERLAFAAPSPVIESVLLLDVDNVSRAPGLNLSGRLDLLVQQYDRASRLRSLLSGVIGVAVDEVVEPLLALDRTLNPHEASGVRLDWIGQRIGLSRPTVTASDIRYLGFEGTHAFGGRPFSQGVFYTRERAIEAVEPLGDATYRRMLLARARRLRGGADRETIEAVLEILFGNGYLDESGDPVTVRFSTDSDLLFLMVGRFQEQLIPRPGGVRITLTRET